MLPAPTFLIRSAPVIVSLLGLPFGLAAQDDSVELSPGDIGGSEIQLLVSGPESTSYSIEKSADLNDWETILADAVLEGTGSEFFDSFTPEARLFYRLRYEEPELLITGLSQEQSLPLAMLEISGVGLPVVEELWVRFSDSASFVVDIPVSGLENNVARVSVPPYLSSGAFGSGEVSLAFVHKPQNVSEKVGLSLSGFTIEDLPVLQSPVGSVTLGYISAVSDLSFEYFYSLQDTPFDTSALSSTLSNQQDALDQLIFQIVDLLDNPSNPPVLGEYAGQELVLTLDDLQIMDRLVVSMMLGLSDADSSGVALLLAKGQDIRMTRNECDSGWGNSANEFAEEAQSFEGEDPHLLSVLATANLRYPSNNYNIDCLSEAFNTGNRVVLGSGSAAVGLLALAGAPAAAVALPSAALLYLTTTNSTMMVGLGTALAETTDAGRKLIQDGLKNLSDLVLFNAFKTQLDDFGGALLDIALGTRDLSQAFFTAPPRGDGASFFINVTTAPNEGGFVTLTPPGPDYADGSEVLVSVETNEGWTFLGWSGACGGTEDCLVVMDENKDITANFSSGGFAGPFSAGNTSSGGSVPCFDAMSNIIGESELTVTNTFTGIVQLDPSVDQGTVSGIGQFFGDLQIIHTSCGQTEDFAIPGILVELTLSGTQANMVASGMLDLGEGLIVIMDFSGSQSNEDTITGTMTWSFEGFPVSADDEVTLTR